MLGRPQVLKYVFSSTLSPTDPEVKVVSGDAVEFVRGLKGQPGAGIWLCGGAGLAGQLLGEIDELVVKRYPVVFGSGIPLFRAPFAPADWQLCGSRVFLTGTTLTSYARRQEKQIAAGLAWENLAYLRWRDQFGDDGPESSR
ncbi:RibD-like protein [Streptomyces noursei ATCC 11455]|nr:RibD-like protein [Streptomyces noursei ATCC 11455]